MRNPTDPHELPGADAHTGERQIDPVTGYDTTGHDWGGILELNTPFPKVALVALGLAFLYSLITWILLPTWPTGRDYTRGALKLDQGEMAMAGFSALSAARQDWLTRFAADDFAALRTDEALMRTAMPAAQRLFADNCAACHGTAGQGGPGYPVLSDTYWLWGGDPETVAETIRVGINSQDLDTRIAQMPPFDYLDRADRQSLASFVTALPEGPADFDSPAGQLFTDNCAACHGDDGAGGLDIGAPSLTDRSAIYGQDAATVFETITKGREGTMPAWTGRLSPAEINLLTLYVTGLGGGPK